VTKKSSTPPPEATFADPPRSTESVTVDRRKLGERLLEVTWSNGWTYGIPREFEKHFATGTHVIVETIRFNQVVGLKVAGEWVWRQSDEQREADEQERRARREKELAERLAENETDWTARTAALPEWLRERLESFLNDPEQGEEFKLRDWAYELAASEVAALYEKHGVESLEAPDHEEVAAYAHEHGTTGNQHGWALAAVRGHRRELAEIANPTPPSQV
jgi:hypothetical protein